MAIFEISLVSPEALVFFGEVEQVDLPGTEGDLGVLAGHAPIVAALRPGIVRMIADGKNEEFVVLGGIAEFSQSTLNIRPCVGLVETEAAATRHPGSKRDRRSRAAEMRRRFRSRGASSAL